MRILIVENDRAKAEQLEAACRSEGIATKLIVQGRWGDASGAACAALREVKTGVEAYDAIVLDIDFDDHKYGGILVYAEIMTSYLRGKFRHILVWTRHQDKKSKSFEYVDVFGRLAFIPPKNIMPKVAGVGNALAVIERLRELSNEQNTPIASYDMWKYS